MNEPDTTGAGAAPQTPPARSPQTPRTNKKRGSSSLWAVGAGLGIAVLAGGAYVLDLFPGAKQADTPANTLTANDPSSLVATVNGIEITRSELDKKITELQASYQMDTSAPLDAGLELQVLNEVVNLHLLVQAAEAQNITVTDEEVATSVSDLVTKMGGPEAFATQLTAAGLTEEALRKNMHNEMLIRKLLDANTDIENITVSDEEISTMYKDATALAPEGQEVPPLAEVSEIARAQLTQQKSAEIITAYIDQLRAKAAIDIKL